MKGRQESSEKVEAKIKVIMDEHSDIIKKYYGFINDKTHNTKFEYIHNVKNYLDYLKNNKINIEDVSIYKNIKPADIREYMNSIKYKKTKDGELKELSSSYRTLKLAAVRSFYDFLIDGDYIEMNPCSKVKLGRVKEDKKIVYLTPTEVAIVKDNIKCGVGNHNARARQEKWCERDMAIIHLLLHTGLRVSALAEINVEDVDLENSIIRVTEKENYTRDIFIDELTNDYIKSWIEKRNSILSEEDNVNALFVSSERKRITPLSINNLVKKYTYNIDKKITPHKLRATFATTVYEKTRDIYITSNLIGHASVETTKRYANIADEQRRAAINLIANVY